MRNYEIMAAFEKVLKRLEVIDAKISRMPQVQVQVSSRFLPTINALNSLGEGTASQVSRVTGRSRAFESKNLNELYTIGLLSKHRQGRTKVFRSIQTDLQKT
jgi:hypothetical protein